MIPREQNIVSPNRTGYVIDTEVVDWSKELEMEL